MSDDYLIRSINSENIKNYDILCLKSKQKTPGYQQKLEWLEQRFTEGLQLKILYVNEGKRNLTSRGMIEFIPGRYNWRGISAEGYMVIHCLWVVGKHKRKGYGSKLLQECIKASENMFGVAVVTSKRNWLVKNTLFKKHNFEKVDEITPFELYVYKTKESHPSPSFNQSDLKVIPIREKGIEIYRSAQCPYTYAMQKYVKKFGLENNIPVETIEIKTSEQAQNGYSPYGTFYTTFENNVVTYESIPRVFDQYFQQFKNRNSNR